MKHAMRTKTLGICWAVLLAAGCGSPSTGDSNDPNLASDIGVTRAGLHKGTAGAQNGDANYCDDPNNPCAAGEGDCDKAAQCETGLVCGRSKLTQFGFAAGDACVPAHCTNKVKDVDETQIDCGGSCGTTCPPVVCPANGAANRCSLDCLCAAGEGDCDSSAECVSPLVCGRNKGAQFGLPPADVCVPAHCTNNRKDGDETQIDCGGSCGTTCAPPVCNKPNGAGDKCSTDCLCTAGEGDCDSNDDCVSPLVCGHAKGAQFGLPPVDVCVPAHCKNNRMDGDETGIDCGGSCGTCLGGGGTGGAGGMTGAGGSGGGAPTTVKLTVSISNSSVTVGSDENLFPAQGCGSFGSSQVCSFQIPTGSGVGVVSDSPGMTWPAPVWTASSGVFCDFFHPPDVEIPSLECHIEPMTKAENIAISWPIPE